MRIIMRIAVALLAYTITYGAAADARSRDEFIRAEDGRLLLNGKRYRFVGVNAYSLLSYPHGTGRFTCGPGFTENGVREYLQDVADMRANTVRIQAYQNHLRDPNDPSNLDFTRLDLVVREARTRGITLIVTLENQWWDCNKGGYKRPGWYESGYRAPYGGNRLSYRDYVAKVVARYKDEPAILMWQLMNEAESKGIDKRPRPEPLMTFTADMTAVIREHDPNHLVSLGTIGVLRAGSGGPFFALLHHGERMPEMIDAHDYHQDDVAWTEEMDLARATARALGKPFFIGETGIKVGSNDPGKKRHGPKERADLMFQKLIAAWEQDVDGIVIWSYRSAGGRGHDFDRNDPLFDKVRYFASNHLLLED